MFPRQDSVFFPRFSIDGSIPHLYSQAQPRLTTNQPNPQGQQNEQNQPNQSNHSNLSNQPNRQVQQSMQNLQSLQNLSNQPGQHQQAAPRVVQPHKAQGQPQLGSRRSSLKVNTPLTGGNGSVSGPGGGSGATAAGYMQYPQDFGYMDMQRDYSLFYPPNANNSTNQTAVVAAAAAAAAMASQYNPYLQGYSSDHLFASRRPSEQPDPYDQGVPNMPNMQKIQSMQSLQSMQNMQNMQNMQSQQFQQYQRSQVQAQQHGSLLRRPSYAPSGEFDALLRRDTGVGDLLESIGYQDAPDGAGKASGGMKGEASGAVADSAASAASAASTHSTSQKTAANKSSHSSSPVENAGEVKAKTKTKTIKKKNSQSPSTISPGGQKARQGSLYQMPPVLPLPPRIMGQGIAQQQAAQQQFQQFQFAQPQFRRPFQLQTQVSGQMMGGEGGKLQPRVPYRNRKWSYQAKEAIKKAAAIQQPTGRKRRAPKRSTSAGQTNGEAVQKRKRARKKPQLKKEAERGKFRTSTRVDSGKDKKVLIPASEAMHTEDGRPLVGATKVDQLMLVIQAREKGIRGNIKQAADGTILGEVEGSQSEKSADGVSVLPNLVELVGGVEKKRIRGKKKFKCQYCSKKFTQSTHLDVHIRSHIGLKPFPCHTCGKRFTQRGNLRTHMRIHTGEKPYTCTTCGKKFARLGGLQSHQLTHTDKKPFKCKFDHCNKSFTQLGNMKAHQNRFHQKAIKKLTDQLARLTSPEEIAMLPKEERELLKYFAGLYKNMNRGIRGRGRGSAPLKK